MVNGVKTPQQLFHEGSTFLQAGNAAEALVCFQTILSSYPLEPTVNLFTGSALHDLGRYAEAADFYRVTLTHAPQMGEAHNNLGNSLLALGQFTEAAECFRRAAVLLPTSPVPVAARASALQALGDVSAAEAECRKAVTIAPDFPAAHWNLALNLLLQGRYLEGWQEYEWRWLKPDFTSPRRHTEIPLWDGSPLNGQTILLHAEQGFGDAIQFVRYAPLVAECGGSVIIECHPQLVQLFLSIEGVQNVVAFGATLPSFSCHAPLLSLPRLFGTTLQTIPSSNHYLSVVTYYRQKWFALLSGYSAVLRVGLVWAGKSFPDPFRSCRLGELAPLALVGDVTFFSLQVGSGSEQASSPPTNMRLIDLTPQIDDFADTAALIEQLDLVISIDTAVAHLAGALGKPVWLLLPFAPDWRWLCERCDSPWYPGMRLFRQEEAGIWDSVVMKIAADLSRLM
jgi:tetratricopeptide (TPR) repeat protein